MNKIDTETLSISIPTSNWNYIKIVREFAKSYLRIQEISPEDLSHSDVTVIELIENSFKFSTTSQITLSITVIPQNKEISFDITNDTNADDAMRAIALINKMNSNEDSFAFYINLMKDKNSKTKKGGGLGLARINYEAKAKITSKFNEKKSEINIKALLNYQKRGDNVNVSSR